MEQALATFAGGCFWCMQPAFEQIPGVDSVVAGFTGGEQVNPSYEDVCLGYTGHVEAIQITYQPERCAYAALLDRYWRQCDPTDAGGQFADRGEMYQSVIFVHNPAQQELAERSKQALQENGIFSRPIVTQIRPAMPFYAAEDYHQAYHKKDPLAYCLYREGSGRDRFLWRVWGGEHNAK
ncbi:MAG: peptide-methionine (S)-S-oxide reductase MsrA [Peptococcaceae bacterium]|jgi:methionine-S-sulfoxide reductase|nr:peptide-methionine (S)-S-oxide reductase MsrA [Peptococcaceae bacterium]